MYNKAMKIRSMILFAVMTAGFTVGSYDSGWNSRAEEAMERRQDTAEEVMKKREAAFLQKIEEIVRQVEQSELASQQEILEKANRLTDLLNSITGPEDLSQNDVDLANAVNELAEKFNSIGEPGLANELREAFMGWNPQGLAGMFAPR